MTKHSIAKFCTLAAGILVIPTVSWAGTAAPAKETKEIKEIVKESCITGDIGVSVTTAYLSRGVVQEDTGFIAQPYLNLYFKLYEGEGFVNKIQLNLGLWASIHSEKTAATPGTRLGSFYEFDWMPGIAMTFAKNFTATLSWFDFDFVSSSGRSGNLNLNLAYDDSELLGVWALKPHVTVMKAFIGNPSGHPGADNSWYFEAGIAPGFPIGPVTVTIPVTAGFGDNNFYAGDTLGYISAGPTVSMPLKFIPECYGSWTASVSALYYYLSDNNAAFNRGDHNKVVGTFTLSAAF